jgi:glycosyltransferase involved in cell wall biosynthesis
MSLHTERVLLDLRDVGRNHRGVARALREIGQRLLMLDCERYVAVCSPAGLDLLPAEARSRLKVVPPHSQAVFEQLTLPAIATRLGVGAIYSHRECGALWGPKMLLHVPEDPEVRWRETPLSLSNPKHGKAREYVRRRYSRLVMNASLRRSRVVTSTYATALDLQQSHGLPVDRVTVVPLGTDLDQFRSLHEHADERPYVFHLTSDDPREQTGVVIDAFAQFAARTREPVRLVIAGDLGDEIAAVAEQVTRLRLGGRVELPGRVTDDHLVDLYSGATATVIGSAREGFGLQALEAMACGSLLVAVEAPATKEVAAAADVEWTSSDSGSIAAAFERVLPDTARQARATAVNRTAASRFTWDATAQRLHELLGEMLNESLRTPSSEPA